MSAADLNPIPQQYVDNAVTQVPIGTGVNTEAPPLGHSQSRRLQDGILRTQNIEQQPLYQILAQADNRFVAGTDAAREAAQPIIGDTAATIDKQIIRLNNYIRSITSPNEYLINKLKSLISVRQVIKNMKEMYVRRFMGAGYTEQEALAMATAIINPVAQAEMKIYQEQLPDRLSDLAAQVHRQSYGTSGLPGAAGLQLGQNLMNMGL